MSQWNRFSFRLHESRTLCFVCFQAAKAHSDDFADISTDSVESSLSLLEQSSKLPPTPGTPITNDHDLNITNSSCSTPNFSNEIQTATLSLLSSLPATAIPSAKTLGSEYWNIPNLIQQSENVVKFDAELMSGLCSDFDLLTLLKFVHRPNPLISECRIVTDLAGVPRYVQLTTCNVPFVVERLHNFVSLNKHR